MGLVWARMWSDLVEGRGDGGGVWLGFVGSVMVGVLRCGGVEEGRGG